MYSDIMNGGLTVLNRAGDLLRRGGGSNSLVDFTSVGRVEPVVLIEQNALHLDCIGEVQQSLLSIFAGYYLQAASLMNTIGNVRVLERLDALNPNRSPVNAGLSTWLIATESYEHGLPFPSDDKLKLSVESGMGSLGGAVTPSKAPNEMVQSKSYGQPGGDVRPVAKDVGKTMVELANLSVGKSYEVNISDGQHSIPVQINIRLIASMLPSPDLIHILATGSEDNSFKERWHGWKSGRLSFWKDLVFCNDLIDKHRKDLLKDKTGTLSNIDRTNFSNSLTSVITGQPSIASSSNMVVLTKDSADQLELQLEGKLNKFDIRQRMMKKTSLMIMAIVDEVDYNTVTFYYRDIALPTTVRIKDLKASNKANGPDIGEILKSLMGGHPVSL
jgi:hypothetical protein